VHLNAEIYNVKISGVYGGVAGGGQSAVDAPDSRVQVVAK
jgi:hypothetical protein